jgi:alpha-1,3-glucosyltransferase
MFLHDRCEAKGRTNDARSCRLLATHNAVFFRMFVIASVSGIASLFPLLFTPMGKSPQDLLVPYESWRYGMAELTSRPIWSIEIPIKIIYTLAWCLLTFSSLSRLMYQPPPTLLSTLVRRAETAYLVGFLPLLIYVEILSPFLHRNSGGKGVEEKPFLPLMAMSVWCAIGMSWSWARLAVEGMRTDWTMALGEDGDGQRVSKSG